MIRRSVLIVPATIESALIDLIFAASIVASAILAFVTAPSWIAAEPMDPSFRTPFSIQALFTFARSIFAFLALISSAFSLTTSSSLIDAYVIFAVSTSSLLIIALSIITNCA